MNLCLSVRDSTPLVVSYRIVEIAVHLLLYQIEPCNTLYSRASSTPSHWLRELDGTMSTDCGETLDKEERSKVTDNGRLRLHPEGHAVWRGRDEGSYEPPTGFKVKNRNSL